MHPEDESPAAAASADGHALGTAGASAQPRSRPDCASRHGRRLNQQSLM